MAVAEDGCRWTRGRREWPLDSGQMMTFPPHPRTPSVSGIRAPAAKGMQHAAGEAAVEVL